MRPIFRIGRFSKITQNKGIPLNQRRAAVGESATEVVLKPLAQVSSPVRLSEYAIDYFCRLYRKNKPNEIFLVEVKTALTSVINWKREIKRDTIEFWLSQPCPVYIVIYDLQNDICYWVSVEANREKWTKKLEEGSKSISIRVDSLSQILKKSPDSNDDFLKKIEDDTIRLDSFNGIPRILYLGGKGINGVFHFQYPDLGLLSNSTRKKFRNTIRYSLFLLVRDELSKDLQEAYRLSKILTEYDTGHYENFELRADVCAKLKKWDEAREYYNKAIDCLKGDPNWDNNRPPEEKSRAELISEIELKLAQIPTNQCNQD